MGAAFWSISTFINSTSLFVIDPTLRLLHEVLKQSANLISHSCREQQLICEHTYKRANTHTDNHTHFGLRISGDSWQTLALHPGMRKNCLMNLTLLSSLRTRQRSTPVSNPVLRIYFKLWSDTSSWLFWCPPSDEIWPDLCLCCAPCHTSLASLSQTLPLQFPLWFLPPYLLWLFPSSLCTPVASATQGSLIQPQTRKAAHPEERLPGPLYLCHGRG